MRRPATHAGVDAMGQAAGFDAADTDTAVQVRQLSVAYGSTLVLDRFDLRVPVGTAVAVVGENGAGKSTLLRCVTGLQEPSGGEVTVFGARPGRGAEFWRAVATTVESPSWYPGLTVREHLRLVRLAHGAGGAHNNTHAADNNTGSAGSDADGAGYLDRVCEDLGLAGLDDSLPLTLSSGQRQRFLLTAKLVRPSRLLVLDEPEQRLDSTIKRRVAARLRRYVELGGTLVMASHDEEFRAAVGATPVTLRRPGS